MPYMIDGHNLIPKAGLRLDSVDDELELIAALQEYSRASRKAIEVYFDGAPAGAAGTKRFGRVTAHFVRQASTADEAIRAHLKRLGGAAKNWTVVSSDRAVQMDAKAAGAGSQTSEMFAKGLLEKREGRRGEGGDERRREGGGLSDDELRHWLDVFKKR
jgi:predicted RNA-binding protein with PIN domain